MLIQARSWASPSLRRGSRMEKKDIHDRQETPDTIALLIAAGMVMDVLARVDSPRILLPRN